jgi:hypothetical protein
MPLRTSAGRVLFDLLLLLLLLLLLHAGKAGWAGGEYADARSGCVISTQCFPLYYSKYRSQPSRNRAFSHSPPWFLRLEFMVRAGEVPHVLLQSFCQRRWMSGTECSLLRANVAKRHATVAWNQPSPYSFRHTVLGLALCLRFEARVDYQETVVNLDVYDGRDDLSSSAQRACTSNDPEVRRLCIGHVSGGASGLLSTFARERMRRLAFVAKGNARVGSPRVR